ncbi:hypothetical protein [Streptomyces thermolilacinus]|uniref:Extensin n=1 Tax=Streptomyces thermolilacinus SPC6 TaxID=1306406 RepID=A0A1D3DQV6_9ACTN|nr:hypothetical protein [Streptomyces thermolilacinus]OEJ94707.1 hypothetical protein J116_009710 [Streptomyces thermolilacinus SPC6]
MADERNEWLDHEAAERLLRGEPVDADDDYTRWQVERLAKALDSARGATAPLSPGHSGELPGEAAAVAAFRAAHSARGAKPHVAAGSDLGSVRIGAALRAPRWARPRGWMRPARWGLAASVAGLAVGGVAVAAGTGVIPAFGGDDAPVPAVSAAAPGEVEAPEGRAHTPPGSHRHGTPTDPASPPPLVPPGPSKGVGGTATPGGGTPDDNDGATPGRTEPDWGRTETRAPDGTWPARTTQACRDLRDGRLDTARRQQLELAARGSGVQQFCDQVLSGGGRQSGGTPPGTGTGTGTGGAPDIGTGTGGGGTSGGGTSGGGSTGGGDRDSGDPDTDRGEGKPGGKGRTDDKGASGRTSGTQHQKSPAEPPTGKRA